MTPTEDLNPPAPAEPRPPVPDPARPALPPITRVNSRLLYAAAILGLIIIWVVTFTVTSRHPQTRPPAPPQTQDAAPNLDSLASLAERVRVAQEMQKKLAAPKRPAPFDPVRALEPDAGTDEQALSALSSSHQGPASPSLGPRPPAAPVRYMAEAPRPVQVSPAVTRYEEALTAPPLIAPGAHASRAQSFEPPADGPAAGPTDRLASLLERHLPGDSTALEAPRRTAEPAAADSAQSFLARSRPAAAPRIVQPESPLSPYVLYEGTILPAVLTSELRSDLPGIATATLRSPVYDSPTGRHLILPPGTRALGEYDSSLSGGDSRLLVSWHRLILPDGRYFEIPVSAAADVHGATGLADKTDRHLARAFTTTLLLSILGAGAQLSQPTSAYSNTYHPPTAGEVAAGAIGQQIAHLSSELLGRDLQVKPTLSIRPGTAFSIVLQADLVFSAPYAPPNVEATESLEPRP